MSKLTAEESETLKTLLRKLGPTTEEEFAKSEVKINNNLVDYEYLNLLQMILDNGRVKKNRTGIDTIGIFGAQAKYEVDMDAFPILTTKKIFFKAIVHELLWFIRGDTNIKYLVDNNVHIWDDWAYAKYKKSKWPSLEAAAKDAKSSSNEGLILYTQDEFIERIKSDDGFADKWGKLGEGTYGGMWRAFPYFEHKAVQWEEPSGPNGFVKTDFGTVDQLKKVVEKLKTNPDDRRMIVSAWHPYWVDHCALPPCHCMFHFNTEELTDEERIWLLGAKSHALAAETGKFIPQLIKEGKLSMDSIPKRRLNCLLYQRSCDTFLGVPFNITSYALLTAMIAHCVGMVPGTFTHTYGDLHIYTNHQNQIQEQLLRQPKNLPQLWLNPAVTDLFAFKYEDIKLIGYDPHPAIKGEVAV